MRNADSDIAPGMFARVQLTEELDEGEVAIGIVLRKALGIPFGSRVTLLDDSSPAKGVGTALIDRALQFRPVILRTRKATDLDTGFKVCRIPDKKRDLLGVEWGDRVIIESSIDRVSVKALPLTDAVRRRRRREMAEGEMMTAYANDDIGSTVAERGGDRGRTSNRADVAPCLRVLNVSEEADVTTDIPLVYMDIRLRARPGLTQKPNSGVCQPVRVYRDARSAPLRSLNEVIVPVAGGGLGFLVIFDSHLGLLQMLGVFGGAILVVASVLYQTRKIRLD